jgi:hypothetical protein
LETLKKEIIDLFRSDPSRAESLIESCLERELGSLSGDDKLAAIESLINYFHSAEVVSQPEVDSELHQLSGLFSLFLGKKVSHESLLSTEFLEKLADSLNTLFNALNETVGIIDGVLLGSEAEPVTIKAIISSNIAGNSSTDSLLNYVNKIKRAFLISQTAFKEAAFGKFEEVLAELNPEHIAAMSSRSLAFGPFKKAELFTIYEERHRLCRQYFESGRLMDDMLRSFEKVGQTLYGKGMRGNQ